MYNLYKINIYSANKLIKSVLQVAESPEHAIELVKALQENKIFVDRSDTFSANVVDTPGYDAFYVPHGKENYIRWYGTERALVIERDMLLRLMDYIARGEYAQLQGYIMGMMKNISAQGAANNLNGLNPESQDSV